LLPNPGWLVSALARSQDANIHRPVKEPKEESTLARIVDGRSSICRGEALRCLGVDNGSDRRIQFG
jgi:hypothetical protein